MGERSPNGEEKRRLAQMTSNRAMRDCPQLRQVLRWSTVRRSEKPQLATVGSSTKVPTCEKASTPRRAVTGRPHCPPPFAFRCLYAGRRDWTPEQPEVMPPCGKAKSVHTQEFAASKPPQ
ncbi:hypothetical protein NEUTE1DRAFT_111936 [Neurospora tetrasperma FGSC 2508]|uniref:Uncharacterized protein n=1 Tax=Neurospora tetrasperma (strain FGSC 2508 / ATCC MYA-4615 / P0657) TaxID=510951 RepID=F8MTQ8_NEUT8|nr:uncharacterized protein NEUTE1DRAFT_111936 [Neurospora tetrasperma FGSC 2508]EGO55390.1 hypothetical protein NEUTE1DRAFT_111936 [Neurospora tetrasperma FGSC 2508]